MKTYWCRWKSGVKEMLAQWRAEDETDLVGQIARHKGALVEIVDIIEDKKEDSTEMFLKKGRSIQDAIKIYCDSPLGVMREASILNAIFKERRISYKKLGQVLIHRDERHYDKITVETSEGCEEDYYFDITLFYGKDTNPSS